MILSSETCWILWAIPHPKVATIISPTSTAGACTTTRAIALCSNFLSGSGAPRKSFHATPSITHGLTARFTRESRTLTDSLRKWLHVCELFPTMIDLNFVESQLRVG